MSASARRVDRGAFRGEDRSRALGQRVGNKARAISTASGKCSEQETGLHRAAVSGQAPNVYG